MPSSTLAEVVEVLDLETVEVNLFRARHPPESRQRLYGGQIMAQALVAATRTVDGERSPHSLHGYFLRPGDPGVPAVIEVERIRDGRSFATRRVVVVQHGRAIFNMDVSFQRAEPGSVHQDQMPDVQAPSDDLIPDGLRKLGAFIEFRMDHRRLLEDTPQPPHQMVWLKTTAQAPGDPVIQRALLVYQSDSALLSTARMPHRGSFDRNRMQVASLDHVMYFHHAFDVNDWLLYVMDSPAAAGARGFTRGAIFTRDGVLAASTMQEGLIRLR